MKIKPAEEWDSSFPNDKNNVPIIRRIQVDALLASASKIRDRAKLKAARGGKTDAFAQRCADLLIAQATDILNEGMPDV